MGNKTNVKYTSIKYEFDESQKRVKCILGYDIMLYKYPLNEIKMSYETIEGILKDCGINGIYIDSNNNIGIEMISIGTSSCHEHDEYDETIGKRIALTRAQAKAFEKTCRVYDCIAAKLDMIIQETIRYINNNWDAANKCWAHVLEIDDCGIVTDKMNNINK